MKLNRKSEQDRNNWKFCVGPFWRKKRENEIIVELTYDLNVAIAKSFLFYFIHVLREVFPNPDILHTCIKTFVSGIKINKSSIIK